MFTSLRIFLIFSTFGALGFLLSAPTTSFANPLEEEISSEELGRLADHLYPAIEVGGVRIFKVPSRFFGPNIFLLSYRSPKNGIWLLQYSRKLELQTYDVPYAVERLDEADAIRFLNSRLFYFDTSLQRTRYLTFIDVEVDRMDAVHDRLNRRELIINPDHEFDQAARAKSIVEMAVEPETPLSKARLTAYVAIGSLLTAGAASACVHAIINLGF